MNKTVILLYLLTLSISFNSCNCKKSNKNAHSSQEEKEQKDWSYKGDTGPKYWGIEVETDSDCSGLKQSPINIIDSIASLNNFEDNPIEIFYEPKTILHKVKNNGHTVQFDFKKGNSIEYKDDIYDLAQLHFHGDSEHTVNGERYPIEIHLVHKNDKEEITVLGMLGREGGEHQLFEFFSTFLPIVKGENREIMQSIDLATIFNAKRSFYSYHGSLTTPPCTENVNWVMFSEPITLPSDVIARIKENMPTYNFRNEQPLNGRTIYLTSNP